MSTYSPRRPQSPLAPFIQKYYATKPDGEMPNAPDAKSLYEYLEKLDPERLQGVESLFSKDLSEKFSNNLIKFLIQSYLPAALTCIEVTAERKKWKGNYQIIHFDKNGIPTRAVVGIDTEKAAQEILINAPEKDGMLSLSVVVKEHRA
jgi:hypothetical protein